MKLNHNPYPAHGGKPAGDLLPGLSGADLRYAVLTGATIDNCMLDCATWTDGTQCGVGSSYDAGTNKCIGGSTDTCY